MNCGCVCVCVCTHLCVFVCLCILPKDTTPCCVNQSGIFFSPLCAEQVCRFSLFRNRGRQSTTGFVLRTTLTSAVRERQWREKIGVKMQWKYRKLVTWKNTEKWKLKSVKQTEKMKWWTGNGRGKDRERWREGERGGEKEREKSICSHLFRAVV